MIAENYQQLLQPCIAAVSSSAAGPSTPSPPPAGPPASAATAAVVEGLHGEQLVVDLPGGLEEGLLVRTVLGGRPEEGAGGGGSGAEPGAEAWRGAALATGADAQTGRPLDPLMWALGAGAGGADGDAADPGRVLAAAVNREIRKQVRRGRKGEGGHAGEDGRMRAGAGGGWRRVEGMLVDRDVGRALRDGVDLSKLNKRAQRIIRTREAASRNRREQKAKMYRLQSTNEALRVQKERLAHENTQMAQQIRQLVRLKEAGQPVEERAVRAIIQGTVAE